eukprot:GHVT01013922.1.p2 GENE.GHVT01013922.1~~GHVT01013922.1.p2  ORF type:complete len:161 (+),score=9.91 GHVT01013922.1:761-1243(+)
MKQDISLVDETCASISVTLWGKKAEEISEQQVAANPFVGFLSKSHQPCQQSCGYVGNCLHGYVRRFFLVSRYKTHFRPVMAHCWQVTGDVWPATCCTEVNLPGNAARKSAHVVFNSAALLEVDRLNNSWSDRKWLAHCGLFIKFMRLELGAGPNLLMHLP